MGWAAHLPAASRGGGVTIKCFKELNLFYILLFKYKNINFYFFYFYDINKVTKTFIDNTFTFVQSHHQSKS